MTHKFSLRFKKPLSDEKFLDALKAIPKNTTCLDCSGIDLSHLKNQTLIAAFNQLKRHHKINAVILNDTKLGNRDNIAILLHAFPDNVKILHLENNNIFANKKLLSLQSFITALSKFKYVNLKNNQIGPETISFELLFEAFSNFSRENSQLQTQLNLSNNNLIQYGINHFIKLLKVIITAFSLTLNNLQLHKISAVDLGDLINTANFQQGVLDLSGNDFGEKGISYLRAILKFIAEKNNIQELNLSNCGLGSLSPEELQIFFSEIPPSVHILKLNNNGFKGEINYPNSFHKAIDMIPHSVHTIYLYNNPIFIPMTAEEMTKFLHFFPKSIAFAYFAEKVSYSPISGHQPSLEVPQKIIEDYKPLPLEEKKHHPVEIKTILTKPPETLEDLQKKYKLAIERYLYYSTNYCQWSFFPRHGETGRQAARLLLQDISHAKTSQKVKQLVNNCLIGLYGGNTHTHSLRTYLLASRENRDISSPDILTSISQNFHRLVESKTPLKAPNLFSYLCPFGT